MQQKFENYRNSKNIDFYRHLSLRGHKNNYAILPLKKRLVIPENFDREASFNNLVELPDKSQFHRTSIRKHKHAIISNVEPDFSTIFRTITNLKKLKSDFQKFNSNQNQETRGRKDYQKQKRKEFAEGFEDLLGKSLYVPDKDEDLI